MTHQEIKRDVRAVVKEIMGIEPSYKEITLLESGDGQSYPIAGHVHYVMFCFGGNPDETWYSIRFNVYTNRYELYYTRRVVDEDAYCMMGTCSCAVVYR